MSVSLPYIKSPKPQFETSEETIKNLYEVIEAAVTTPKVLMVIAATDVG